MFNLKERTITLNGRPDHITQFQVWFQVPTKGLLPNLEDAIKICEGLDLDPNLCIVPVPVAVGQNTYELLIR